MGYSWNPFYEISLFWYLNLDNQISRYQMFFFIFSYVHPTYVHFLWILWEKYNFWLVVWNILIFSIQLGMSSSQLTSIFFRGIETTKQSIYKRWMSRKIWISYENQSKKMIKYAEDFILWILMEHSYGRRTKVGAFLTELSRQRGSLEEICFSEVERYGDMMCLWCLILFVWL